MELQTKACVICFTKSLKNKGIHELSSTMSKKLISICFTYLQYEIFHDSFLTNNEKCEGSQPFCSKCFDAALQLTELADRLSTLQANISNLSGQFSQEILSRRNQSNSELNLNSVCNIVTENEEPKLRLPNCNLPTNKLNTPIGSRSPIESSDNDSNSEASNDPFTHNAISVEQQNDLRIDNNNHQCSYKLENSLSDCEVELLENDYLCFSDDNNMLVHRKCQQHGDHTYFKNVDYECTCRNLLALDNGDTTSCSTSKSNWISKQDSESIPAAVGTACSTDLTQENGTRNSNKTISDEIDVCIAEENYIFVSDWRMSFGTPKIMLQRIASTDVQVTEKSEEDSPKHDQSTSPEDSGTDDYIFNCNQCDRKFDTQKKLRIHRHVHKNNLNCSFCQKVCTDSYKLKLHERIHTGERPYKCRICKKRFISKYNLGRHEYIHKAIRPHKCAYCEKTFTISSNRNRHQLTHSGKKPYKCPFCRKRFSQPNHLKIHIRTHTGEKPFKCPTCKVAFREASKLTRHKRIHLSKKNNGKTHQCDFCKIYFYDKQTLFMHKTIHTGERPFKCLYCDMRFSQRVSRLTHQRTHPNCKKPFTCSICNKIYDTRQWLEKHEKSHAIKQKKSKNCRKV